MVTKVAIIGGGAVAHAHIPIVTESPDSEVAVVVDKDVERARELADANGIEHAVGDWNEAASLADAAIIALPHHLHAPAAIELLEKGLHVLVEKPMGMTLAECDAMIDVAQAKKRVLAVGLVSRWFGIAAYVKDILNSGLIGRVESFDVREGMIYSWPVASDFMFRKETGGGVLADTGAHVLDLVLYWLGDCADLEYEHDAEGGVEADCTLRMTMESGARGVVEMSRTRDLRNTWILRGEKGTLEVMRRFAAEWTWSVEGRGTVLSGTVQTDGKPEDPLECFRAQWTDFLGAIREGREPFLNGVEGRRGVELIERCHAVAKPFAGESARPWEVFNQ
ncbi:MAG TPA: Gfo/Idh/MocA family oxidoreductase [Planctomycetes bacterium]|nr:Gfo/Idh/MocA family oxidoreductase [Planctomycetota bacterium]